MAVTSPFKAARGTRTLDHSPLGSWRRARRDETTNFPPLHKPRVSGPKTKTTTYDHCLYFRREDTPKPCGRDHETCNYKKKFSLTQSKSGGGGVLTSSLAPSAHSPASAIPWEARPMSQEGVRPARTLRPCSDQPSASGPSRRPVPTTSATVPVPLGCVHFHRDSEVEVHLRLKSLYS